MANSSSAKKRVRQTEKKAARNASLRTRMRTAIRKVKAAILSKDHARALATFAETTSVVDKVAQKGVIHKNRAARCKMRLYAKIKVLSTL